MSAEELAFGFDLVWVEAAVAAAVMLAFLLGSLLALKARHRAGDGWRVDAGAAVYGGLIGSAIGFLLVPMRLTMAGADASSPEAGYAGLAVLAVVIALRAGLVRRLPLIGGAVRAYRAAGLRRSIEASQKQLTDLEARASSRVSQESA